MAEQLTAQIKSANIEINDRDLLILTVVARFSNGMSGMIEGHYATYIPEDWKHHDPRSTFAHLLWQWLKVTDSKTVQEMVGKVVRLEMTDDRSSAIPHSVQHAVDDFTFIPSEVVKAGMETPTP